MTGACATQVQRRNWSLDRIQGSHHIYVQPGNPLLASVPVHGNKTLKPKTQRSIMKAAGLTKNFEIDGETVWGETGDYTVVLRCVSAKSIIIRTVAGPEASETSKISLKLKEDFFK